MREANDAFERQDYPRAIELYTEVEDEATDPGAVAFNKATALYRQAAMTDDSAQKAKMLRDAAAYFGRLKEDTARSGRAHYGRANCLLLGQSTDQAALSEAIECYRACLNDPASSELHANARHNFELAKLLLVQAKQKPPAESPKKKPDNSDPNMPEHKPEENPKPMNMGTQEPGPKDKPNDKGTPIQVKPDPGGMDPMRVEAEPMAGTRSLDPVADHEPAVILSPAEAGQDVDEIAEIIKKARNKQLRQNAPKLPEHIQDK